MKRPRGTCNECGRRCYLTKSGYPHAHIDMGDEWDGPCYGTYDRVIELQALEANQQYAMETAVKALV